MWTCQGCGTTYDDAVEVCRPCARANEPEPPPPVETRQVRGVGWLVGAVALCVFLGILVGMAMDTFSAKPVDLAGEEPAPLGGLSERAVWGALIGAGLGVIAWASFPYKKASRPEASEPNRDEAP